MWEELKCRSFLSPFLPGGGGVTHGFLETEVTKRQLPKFHGKLLMSKTASNWQKRLFQGRAILRKGKLL